MIRALDHYSHYALQQHLARHWEENDADQFMVPQPLGAVLASIDPTTWGFIPTRGNGLWQRVWAFREGDHIRAHVIVTGNPFAPHRCTLGMGVERAHREQGLGRKLMTTALNWVHEQPSVDWVDGFALADNEAVLALDYSMGFEAVGRIPDVARFGGRSVDQLTLVLKVR